MADIGASNWNENDTNNNQPAPDGAPEGMSPSGVNDTIRAVMGAVKRWFNWSSPKVTAGSATAYTLTYGVTPGALVDGMTHLVQFHAINGPGATLNVNGLGAKPLYAYSAGAWYQAPPALFDVAIVCRVVYDAGSGAYRLLMPGVVPTGTLMPFAGSVAPAGYLLAFGQPVSRTSYPGLFAVISTTYGNGDGSTTFNVPDLRGFVVAGKDNMGGLNAGRLSSVVPSTTLGAVGGTQTHAHGVSVSVSIGGTASGALSGVAISSTSAEVAAANSGSGAAARDHDHFVSVSGTLTVAGGGAGSGSSDAQSNAQPTFILNQIIKL
jgi:microcystin-dependent protein